MQRVEHGMRTWREEGDWMMVRREEKKCRRVEAMKG